METLNLIKNDPWLEPYADAITAAINMPLKKRQS